MIQESTQDPKLEEIKIPESLPVLPIRNIVIFPYMLESLMVDREKSIRAIDQALAANRMIMAIAQKDSEVENPVTGELYEIGTIGVIVRMLKLPDQRLKILIQGIMRGAIEQWGESTSYFQAKIKPLVETEIKTGSLEQEALVRNVKHGFEKAVSLGKNIASDVTVLVGNLDDPGRLGDLIAANLDLKVDVAQELLAIIDPIQRLLKVNEILTREVQVLTVQQQINIQAKTEIDKTQREYLLRQQLKAIREELGEEGQLQEEVEQFQEKIEKSGMPKEVREEVQRHLNRLEKMHPDLAETATMRNYLDLVVSLPWNKFTEDNLDLRKARQILDEDHFGLEEIKERILEYLAVRKFKEKMKGPILCFVGPPGTGKTSLGRSIARALNRKFARMSLGGVHDEAEIRGHRRTYVGAMPGRIIQAIHQAGSGNPIFMLDEVDKIGMDHRGGPSSALIEVLDPEQNFAFRDNYIGIPFDLSNVLFITTANVLETIHPAFRDRMEVINLSGYTEREKLQITKRHLIPRQIEAHGLTPANISFTDQAILTIVSRYTREAGLRNLEREIASICRKVVKKIAEDSTRHVHVTANTVHEYLGAEKILPDEMMKENRVGVAVGLAWTATGGDVLFVEALTMGGKGDLILTGQLGGVMKESAQAALSYARAHAAEFKIRDGFFSKHDIHIHIPEGAIPKDGPSAGVTLAVAMISACTNRRVRRDVAMTGEITLRGHILSVGGIKEKILAARRAKIHTVIVPNLNRRNADEIPPESKKDMKIIYVDEINQILEHVLI